MVTDSIPILIAPFSLLIINFGVMKDVVKIITLLTNLTLNLPIKVVRLLNLVVMTMFGSTLMVRRLLI